jgi:hypothetical protein
VRAKDSVLYMFFVGLPAIALLFLAVLLVKVMVLVIDWRWETVDVGGEEIF